MRRKKLLTFAKRMKRTHDINMGLTRSWVTKQIIDEIGLGDEFPANRLYVIIGNYFDITSSECRTLIYSSTIYQLLSNCRKFANEQS